MICQKCLNEKTFDPKGYGSWVCLECDDAEDLKEFKLRYNSLRFGWFVISGIVIVKNPEFIKEVMGHCIIVHAAPEPHYDAIKYQAISDDFDEIQKGELMPEYEIIAEKDSDGKVTWEFKRVENT